MAELDLSTFVPIEGKIDKQSDLDLSTFTPDTNLETKPESSNLDMSTFTPDTSSGSDTIENIKAATEPTLGVVDRILNLLRRPANIPIHGLNTLISSVKGDIPSAVASKEAFYSTINPVDVIRTAFTGRITPGQDVGFKSVVENLGVPNVDINVPAYLKPQGVNVIKTLLNLGSPEKIPSIIGQTALPAKVSTNEALGLAGDIALDPITYVTGGYGTETKVAGQTLSKKGFQLLSELIPKNAARISEELASKGIIKPVEELMIAGDKGLSPARLGAERELAKLLPSDPSLIDRGGLKIFGKTVIPQKTFTKAGEAVGKIPGIRQTKDIVGPLFNRDYWAGRVGSDTKEAVQDFYNKVGYKEDKFVNKLVDSLQTPEGKFLNTDQRQAVYEALAKAEDDSKALLGVRLAEITNNKKQIASLMDDIREYRAMANSDIPIDELRAYRLKLKEHTNLLKKAGIPQSEFDKILNDRISSLPEGLQQPARNISLMMKQEAKKDVRLGLLPREIPNYVPRKYVGLELPKGSGTSAGGGIVKSLGGRAKMRKVETLEDARDFVNSRNEELASMGVPETAKLIEDVSVPVAERGIRGIRAREGLALEARLKQLHGGELPELVQKQLNSMKGISVGTPEENALRDGYDKLLNFYKGSLTGLFPAFHARNKITNQSLKFFGVGMEAFDPANFSDVAKIRTGEDGALRTVFGESVPFKTIKEEAAQHGVTNGFYTGDITTTIPEKIDMASKDAFQKLNQNPIKSGRAIGQYIEEGDRLSLFASLRRKGLDPKSAAREVNRVLFDYSNLAPFEKSVMKRVFPFYTFKRKAIEQFATNLVKKPGVFNNIADVKRYLDGSDVTGEEFTKLPDWLKNKVLIKTGPNKYISGVDLGFEDLAYNINKPQSLISDITPLTKIPLEQATGRDFFRNKSLVESAQNIKDIPEAISKNLPLSALLGTKEIPAKSGSKLIATNPRLLELLRNLPTSRITATAASLGKGDADSLSKFLTGIQTQEIDPSTQEYFNKKALEDYLMQQGIGRKFENYYIPKIQKKTMSKDVLRYIKKETRR